MEILVLVMAGFVGVSFYKVQKLEAILRKLHPELFPKPQEKK